MASKMVSKDQEISPQLFEPYSRKQARDSAMMHSLSAATQETASNGYDLAHPIDAAGGVNIIGLIAAEPHAKMPLHVEGGLVVLIDMAIRDATFCHDEIAKALYKDVAIAMAAVGREDFKHPHGLLVVLPYEANHATVHIATPNLAGGYALLGVVEAFRGILHDGVVMPDVTDIGKGGLAELHVLVVDFKRLIPKERSYNAWFLAFYATKYL